MIKELVKPSAVSIVGGLGGSNLRKSEKETVVCNIIVIGRKSGDTWLEFTWEQYQDLCDHEVTDSERTILNTLVAEGMLACDNGVYRVRDKLIATLWDFVNDSLKS